MIAWFLARPLVLALSALSLVLLLALGAQTARLGSAQERVNKLKITLAEKESAWNKVVAQAAADLAQAVEGARNEERRRVEEVGRVAAEAEVRIRTARVDAAAARVSSDRLRQRVEALSRLCHAPAATSDTAVAASSAAASSPGDVLTYVLGRLDQTAGELAQLADERGNAGLACEQSYDALRSLR